MRWSSNCVRSVDAQFREAATKRRVSNTVVSPAPPAGSASVGAATLWHRTGKNTGLKVHGASERQLGVSRERHTMNMLGLKADGGTDPRAGTR
jgi:hypothetical protein